MKKRNTEAFDEAGGKAHFVRSFPCAVKAALVARYSRRRGELCVVVADCWSIYAWGESEAAHVKSRGAGGKSGDMIPLCTRHHNEQHTIGIKTFAERYGLNLTELAAHYERLWQNSGFNPDNVSGEQT